MSAFLYDMLLDFDAKIRKEERIEELKSEVIKLKKKRDVLRAHEQRLSEDINSGTVEANLKSYHLPAAAALNIEQSNQPQPLTDTQLETAKLIGIVKQKVSGLVTVSGVSVWGGEAGGEDTTIVLDTYVMGKHRGPHTLRLRFSPGRVVFRGHTMPHPVQVRDMFMEHMGSQETRGLSDAQLAERFRDFVSVLSKRLRSYLSREAQVTELRKGLGRDLTHLSTSANITQLKFSMLLQEEGDDSSTPVSQSLQVTFSMLYHRDGERPKPDSVEVKFNNEVEELEQILEQCEVFYTKTLIMAIRDVF